MGQSQPGRRDGVLLSVFMLHASQEPENCHLFPTTALFPPQDSAPHSTVGTKPQTLPSAEQKFSSGKKWKSIRDTHLPRVQTG